MADFNIEDILTKITSNPEIMNKVSQIAKSNKENGLGDALPQVMDAIMPALEEKKENDTEENSTNDTATASLFTDALQLPVGKICDKINKNSSLLMALKPYLSKERCDLIDSIVKMARVANLLSVTK